VGFTGDVSANVKAETVPDLGVGAKQVAA